MLDTESVKLKNEKQLNNQPFHKGDHYKSAVYQHDVTLEDV